MTDSLTILLSFLDNESLCLDSSAVGMRIDESSNDPKSVASQARKERKVFAGWNGRHYRYPAFQFEPSGGPRPKIGQLIDVLPKEMDGTIGNDAVLWVFSPDHAFDGKSPSELFPLEPDRVIAGTRIRRDGAPDRD